MFVFCYTILRNFHSNFFQVFFIHLQSGTEGVFKESLSRRREVFFLKNLLEINIPHLQFKVFTATRHLDLKYPKCIAEISLTAFFIPISCVFIAQLIFILHNIER